MPRYKLTLEYDGQGFVGWQRQTNGPSIQTALEDAVYSFVGEKINIYGAGRTDAGVHAKGQVCHFDLTKDYTPEVVRNAVNSHLRPAAISILSVETIDSNFDSRRHATSRTYLYKIINRRSPLALDHGRAWWCPIPLNNENMSDAASLLLGHHDFSTFRAAKCQANSPLRTLDALVIERFDDEIQITGKAQSFLHKQMRAIVGTLKLVGEGNWTPNDVSKALEAKDRKKGGPNAPPHGLYLINVDY